MPEPIDFFFDFASPYGYFASAHVDELARNHGRTVDWHAFMVGAAMKLTGQVPIDQRSQLQQDYGWRDLQRSARYYGVPFHLPEGFPYGLLAASRAFYWIRDADPGQATMFARAVFAAVFGEGRDLRPPAAVGEIAAPLGVERAELIAAVEMPAWKERLKSETGAAIRRGVFGSPFFFVGEEAFWGADRLAMLEWWLGSEA
jgi:2-hydroxychromene-2-carboxylate isomerase